MKVRVKEVRQGFFGFYGGQRRYPGDEFTLKSKTEFSSKWMEVLEEEKPTRVRRTKAEILAETKEDGDE